MDEGYIKFNCIWEKTSALPENQLAELNKARDQMYQQGLIGAYDNGIGFGNISQRWSEHHFVISGSATGNFPKLNEQHYALVTHFDIDQNQVHCEGPIIASSESMSHAVIYQECPEINAVIHIHHLAFWKKLCGQIPTTSINAAYGSPEMAREIIRLLQQTSVRTKEQFFAMAGHEEGLIGFGQNMATAIDKVLSYCSD